MPSPANLKARGRMNNKWLMRLRRIRDILYWLAKVRAERL
jgi:hypothetical protein